MTKLKNWRNLTVMNKENRTLNEALVQASFFLHKHGIDPDLARYYWMELFEWDLTHLVKMLHQPISNTMVADYKLALRRIVGHEPIQYITGKAYFMGQYYRVTPATLIPREETQGLIQRGVAYLSNQSTAQVLDIGTGSGIIAINMKMTRPKDQVWAVDISPEAIEVAKINAKERQIEIHFRCSNLLDKIEKDQTFDLILANLPYIGYEEMDYMDESVKRFEPSQALYAGDDGMNLYKLLAGKLDAHMKRSSLAVFEFGFRQGEKMLQLFNQHFPNDTVWIEQDLSGNDRYLMLRKA